MFAHAFTACLAHGEENFSSPDRSSDRLLVANVSMISVSALPRPRSLRSLVPPNVPFLSFLLLLTASVSFPPRQSHICCLSLIILPLPA